MSQEYPPDSAYGGIGTQTWHKSLGLESRGHMVHVVSCGKPGRTKRGNLTVDRIAPPGERDGQTFTIHESAAYMVGYTSLVMSHLSPLVEQGAFDLVNFPEYGAEGFAFQLNRTVHNWVPVVVQLHGPLAMFAERVGWPSKDSDFYRVGTLMEGVSLRLADGLMASSANIADFVSDFYGVDRASIEVVHCGIDADAFRPPDETEREALPPTVLFVGNLVASKGIKTVFEAVMRLRSKYPDIRLRVLGRGEDDLAERLTERARAAGAGANFELCGFVKERERLPRYYREAHVFASPAHHEVGVANVYVEAMACGCPVVAAASGGAPEAVVDGRSGVLVEPSDIEATTAALDAILANPSMRRSMGQAGRRRVEEYFALEKYLDRVWTVYARTIERSREKVERLTRKGPR